MDRLIKLAQIGCGYWGPNLLRNFTALLECKVSHLVETSEERKEFVRKQHPSVNTSLTFEQILDEESIDGLVIATPAGLHFEQTKQALLANKHVLVEKPMAKNVREVDELIRIASDRKLVLMSGHTFIYNSAVEFIKESIRKGDLGDVRYLYSQRLNLGRIRSDVDALWNFAPHDISIIQYLLEDQKPEKVSSQGMSFIQEGIDDVVFLNIRYPNSLANVHVSWLDPLKVRKIVIVGSEKMIVYDDVADDKISIYDKGVDKFSKLGESMDFDIPQPFSFKYRSGDILVPHIEYVEPLRHEAEEFISCIREGKEAKTGAKHTREVIKILDMASKSKA
jgi:predicted dehydrogenase